MTSPHDPADPNDWNRLVSDAMATAPPTVTAHTFIRSWPTASRPVLVSCDDGSDWVIKGTQSLKQAVTDQILGNLGHAMSGPIPSVAQVDVPVELIAGQPEMSHFNPGRAHGSRFSPGYTDREGLAHAIPENAERFTHLAAFYGWGLAQDHQFIYRIVAPCLVISVDHGHFIGGGSWDSNLLETLPDDADLDKQIETHSPSSRPELQKLLEGLQSLSSTAIANAVALPGTDWDITMDERTGLAALLFKRLEHLRGRVEERLQ